MDALSRLYLSTYLHIFLSERGKINSIILRTYLLIRFYLIFYFDYEDFQKTNITILFRILLFKLILSLIRFSLF